MVKFNLEKDSKLVIVKENICEDKLNTNSQINSQNDERIKQFTKHRERVSFIYMIAHIIFITATFQALYDDFMNGKNALDGEKEINLKICQNDQMALECVSRYNQLTLEQRDECDDLAKCINKFKRSTLNGEVIAYLLKEQLRYVNDQIGKTTFILIFLLYFIGGIWYQFVK